MKRCLASAIALVAAIVYAIPVRAQSINAIAETGSVVAGTASTPIADVAANDSVNGAPAILGASGNSTVAQVSTWPTGISLDTSTGAVSTSIALPVGTYSVQYQLCDLNAPPDCASTADTVTVTASIVPTPDTGSVVAGTASTPIADVAANDSVNGAPAILGASGNSTVAQVSTWPTGISLDTSTGAVSTSIALPVGTYSVQYQLCDLNAPPDCASTADTVTVTASIVPTPESGSADAGIGSRPIANVAANDTVNGAPAILGASGNAAIAQVGTWPTGISLNTSTGAVSTSIALPVGTYSVQYQLCDRNTPANCATAMDTITVITSSIVPTPESGSADAGIGSRPIANVAANDTVNGAPAILGASGNSTVAQVGTWPFGIALTPSTGAVSTSVAVPPGTYSVQYQLCDRNAPANCATATDTITVITASIVPAPESGSADAGTASRPIANVAANDTVNSASAILGASGNATVAQVGTWPTGIALTPSTGAVSTSVAVPPGTYSVQYQLCDKNTPANCATTTDTITVISASVAAVQESGTADAGIASRPIANVAANDTVNGAPAILGTSGNAAVAQVGTWPTGIALTPSTGAVSTSAAIPPGTYSIQYQLCDKNTPAKCATTTDTITVITASIVPTPDTGGAYVGIASRPIANVAANDTVNGAPAILGASGNATVAQVGTWPTGIGLTPSTGAVSTSVAVPVGTYSVQYQLCDKNTPAKCAAATDTVTVTASIVALPIAGSALVGKTSTAIGNVTIKDMVNGAPATLGSSGNATVAPVGTWPAGISLNASTGAVTTTSAVLAGTYNMLSRLCDKNTPANCAITTDTVTVMQPSTEVQASPTVLGDIEFDWGRDGIHCPKCNDGLGNARFNWTDRNHNLWVSYIDWTTGMFVPVSGQQTRVDNTAAFWEDWGNGPEWGFSTPSGSQYPISQLVYTRYEPGEPSTYSYAGAAIATSTNGVWNVSYFPGAISPGNNTILPAVSQCNTDPVALAIFVNLDAIPQSFIEPVSTAPGTTPMLTSFGGFSNEIGERWVPCTHWLTFQGNVTIGTNTLQQVFWYDIDTQVVQQLTFDPSTKQRALMFKAPEFLGQQYQYMLMTLAGDDRIQIYQQNGVGANGAPTFQLFNTIYSPDRAQPYMFDPKAFIHCNPTCHTYVVMGMTQTVNAQFTETKPNGLGLTNVDPANPMFKVLIPSASLPLTQRLDPEYFITANGPYVYYASLLAHTQTQPYKVQGFYFIDMQLGPPSGPCVGSSAEAGLAGPVGTCQ